MQSEVIGKLTKLVLYVENIEKLKNFWYSNNQYIEKIIALYFLNNSASYKSNKEHYNTIAQNIIQLETSEIKEDLINLIKELNNEEYTEQYLELMNRKLFLDNQFQITNRSLVRINVFNQQINIQDLIKNKPMIEESQQMMNTFQGLGRVIQDLDTLCQALASIKYFDLLKNRDTNLILIGANGSGKSTFSRQIKKNISEQDNSFVAVIPAQKTFGVNQIGSIPFKDNAFKEFSQVHTHDKLFKNMNDNHYVTNEFERMINFLIAEHQEVANKTHIHYDTKGFQKNNSILEKVISIWQSIIAHRKLEYDGKGSVRVLTESGTYYEFMALSDGEKNIFFCIASVLTVDKNGYIIVDEPENHLNMSIVNKLWDKLEDTRNDCQFVYLTHSPSFTIGRNQAKILWVKNYTPPSNWEYIEIPNSEVLPQELMVELVGSKKNILFCEGTKDSYDYKLYSILFKNHTVVPAGGHQKAIDYCKAFNENDELSSLKAITIIDKDFYEDEEISAWKKHDIYTLDVMEVENILCDDLILQVVKTKVHASNDDYENAKEEIFTNIKNTIDKQCMDYTRFKTDKILNSLVGKSITPEDLNEQLNNAIKTLNTNIFYNEHLKLLNDICKENDYDKALRYYNNKGMISFVGDKILKDYRNRVVDFIRDDSELQKKLIDKYFTEVPKE